MTIYEILFAFMHKLINILTCQPQSMQQRGMPSGGSVVIVTQILIKFYIKLRFRFAHTYTLIATCVWINVKGTHNHTSNIRHSAASSPLSLSCLAPKVPKVPPVPIFMENIICWLLAPEKRRGAGSRTCKWMNESGRLKTGANSMSYFSGKCCT